MLHAVFAIAWAEDVGMLRETARWMWWERKTACALLKRLAPTLSREQMEEARECERRKVST